jgi:hypothetical protein
MPKCAKKRLFKKSYPEPKAIKCNIWKIGNHTQGIQKCHHF